MLDDDVAEVVGLVEIWLDAVVIENTGRARAARARRMPSLILKYLSRFEHFALLRTKEYDTNTYNLEDNAQN